MADFTQGPWEAVELGKGEALIVQPCDTTRQPICLVDRVPNAWGNANLIAAAPQMYEALDPESLEAIADEIESFEHSARVASLRAIAKIQRTALAKADGKPHA